VQQNTANDLSGPEGFTDLTVAGEMFRMMSENLPGTRVVELQATDPASGQSATTDNSFWLFSGQDHASLFILAGAGQSGEVPVDLSGIFSDLGRVSVERLGVREGDNPVARSARPDLEQLDAAQVINGRMATVDLDPLEIVHMRFDDPVMTTSVTEMLSPPEDAAQDIVTLAEPIQRIVEPEDDPSISSGGSNSEGFDIGSALSGLLLLPMLFALG
jgi:hypothetical protein